MLNNNSLEPINYLILNKSASSRHHNCVVFYYIYICILLNIYLKHAIVRYLRYNCQYMYICTGKKVLSERYVVNNLNADLKGVDFEFVIVLIIN